MKGSDVMPMTMKDIMNVIYELSGSQGFYSRLWERLCAIEQNDPDAYARIKEEWEAHEFTDAVDFILYLES